MVKIRKTSLEGFGMTLKEIHHTVKRPGRTQDHDSVEIPVAEELATVPGIVKKDNDVAWYSRNYPIVSQNVEKAADREWTWTVLGIPLTKSRPFTSISRSSPTSKAEPI